MGSSGSLLKDNNQAHMRENTVREKFLGEFTSGSVIAGNGDDGVVDLEAGSEPRLNASVFHAKALFMKPVLRNRTEKDKSVIKKQDNRDLLREIYRRMDPTKNRNTAVDGEVEFGAKFKPNDNILLVKIGQARGLSMKFDSVSPNPFVVVDIFPATNPSDITTRKTHVLSSTCTPHYEDVLTFPIDEQSIPHTKLRVSVWDKANSSQSVFLGESLHDICKLNTYAGVVSWYALSPRTDLSISGSLQAAVAFKQPKSLIVTVECANNVKKCDEAKDQTTNPYAKVYVSNSPTTFQTKAQIGSVNPVWMETFEFDVNRSEFSKAFIVISVFNKGNAAHYDQRLGDVHIPLADHNFEENGTSKEYALKDLRNAAFSRNGRSEGELSLEFREALKAHMMYCYPKFIFKKHEPGSRVAVTCKSRRAQKRATIIIENGTVV